MPDAASAVRGVGKPRRPQASPLFRLVSDHLQRLQTVHDDRFAREYGPWRPVVAQVADKLLACSVLDHGFAHIRCNACAHEFLLACSCRCRYCCPSCHAKRLAIWTQWLDTILLAPVPHRQVLLTIPKRLRAEDQATGMFTWPHAGFHVHTAVWVFKDDRAFAARLARYCTRNPVALERRTYDRTAKAVTYRSDKFEGPTAGTETADPLEFLARVLVRIPEKGHVTTRYHGWSASRPPGHATDPTVTAVSTTLESHERVAPVCCIQRVPRTKRLTALHSDA